MVRKVREWGAGGWGMERARLDYALSVRTDLSGERRADKGGDMFVEPAVASVWGNLNSLLSI